MKVKKSILLMALAVMLGVLLKLAFPDEPIPPKFSAKEETEWMLAPPPDVAQRSEQAFQQLLARLPQAQPAASAESAAPAKPPKPVWTLKGIVDKDNKLALIEIDGKIKRLKTGANVTAEEKLLAIQDDHVVIETAAKKEHILLYRTDLSKVGKTPAMAVSRPMPRMSRQANQPIVGD